MSLVAGRVAAGHGDNLQVGYIRHICRTLATSGPGKKQNLTTKLLRYVIFW